MSRARSLIRYPLSCFALLGALATSCAGGEFTTAEGALGGSGSNADAESCKDDPTVCSAGTTCWPSDEELLCLPAGAGQAGDACLITPGEPTCDEGLMCAPSALGGGGGYQCAPTCNPDSTGRPCPIGTRCNGLMTGTPDNTIDFWVCI